MENRLKKLFNEKLNLMLSALFLLGGYLYDLRYLIRYGKLLIDSDMAAELILSDLLNKNHCLFLTDFIYSTELKVVETQIFYRIGLWISPNDWHVARVIGMALMLALLAAGICLLTWAAGWKSYSLWAGGFALWPLGFWYCFQTTFGGYYLPFAIFSFFSLFCVVKLSCGPRPKARVLFYLLLGLLAFFSGTNGVRQMMIFFAPLMLAAVFMMFAKGTADGKKFFIPSLYAFVCNFAGYLFNMLYLAKHYIFLTQDEYVWGGGTNSWLKSLKWYFESFGYYQVSDMHDFEDYHGTNLFSFDGIAMGCGLLIGFAVCFSLLYLIHEWKKLKETDLFLAAVCVSMVFVIGFVFTYLHGLMQYWQQTMGFGFVALLICIHNLRFRRESLRIAAVLLLAVATLICAKGTVRQSLKYPLRSKPELGKVVEWILENTDYRKGRASFWYSNVVAELSDGQIEMYTMTEGKRPVTPNRWLQAASHLTDYPENHYFILCRRYEDPDDYDFLINELQAFCIYDDERYVVFAVE